MLALAGWLFKLLVGLRGEETAGAGSAPLTNVVLFRQKCARDRHFLPG